MERKVLEALDKLRVKREEYHGHVFVGNHCKKILADYDVLCSVLDGYPAEKAKFQEIFKLFSEPRNLLFAKRFLSDEEINTVVFLCEEFCKRYPVLFPDKNLKPKMHFYSFDVPNFVKTHESLGLLSEEEGESLQSAFNMENRQLYSVKNGGNRMFLGLKRHALRSKCD